MAGAGTADNAAPFLPKRKIQKLASITEDENRLVCHLRLKRAQTTFPSALPSLFRTSDPSSLPLTPLMMSTLSQTSSACPSCASTPRETPPSLAPAHEASPSSLARWLRLGGISDVEREIVLRVIAKSSW